MMNPASSESDPDAPRPAGKGLDRLAGRLETRLRDAVRDAMGECLTATLRAELGRALAGLPAGESGDRDADDPGRDAAVKSVLDDACLKLEQILHAMERATLALLDESGRHLTIRASYGLSVEEEQRGVYGLKEGIYGQVFAAFPGSKVVVRTLDAGSDAGLRADMTVVAAQGLVGRIQFGQQLSFSHAGAVFHIYFTDCPAHTESQADILRSFHFSWELEGSLTAGGNGRIDLDCLSILCPLLRTGTRHK